MSKLDQCLWTILDRRNRVLRLCRHRAKHSDGGDRYCTHHIAAARLRIQRTVEAIKKATKK